jgi:uncharacterized protein (TIGR02466 family)
MSKKEVFPLFSAPLYVNNVGDFERPDSTNLQFTSNIPTGGVHTFLSSIDKNVLERPEFKDVRSIVMNEVNSYAREILRVNESIEFYITNSWINVYRPGDYCVPHTHNNSLISGVLYLNVTETSGNLLFYRDILSLLPFPPALDLDIDSSNIYHCKTFGHKPKTNDICLFPSILMHSAERNNSNEDRCCLSFNVFVRGDIGSLHKLKLK